MLPASHGNLDFTIALFLQNVLADPANALHVRSFLFALRQKQVGCRKDGLLTRIAKACERKPIRKAAQAGQWASVLRKGLEFLAANPWDVETVRLIAMAAAHFGHGECELCYLQFALQTEPHDPDTNRQSAVALGRQGRTAEALACWRRVQDALPQDAEAQQAIAQLTRQGTRNE
jgi:Flp pilus assembly protein TadD